MYFRRWFEVFDLAVVTLSTVLTVAFVIVVDYSNVRLGVATIVLRLAVCLYYSLKLLFGLRLMLLLT